MLASVKNMLASI